MSEILLVTRKLSIVNNIDFQTCKLLPKKKHSIFKNAIIQLKRKKNLRTINNIKSFKKKAHRVEEGQLQLNIYNTTPYDLNFYYYTRSVKIKFAKLHVQNKKN